MVKMTISAKDSVVYESSEYDAFYCVVLYVRTYRAPKLILWISYCILVWSKTRLTSLASIPKNYPLEYSQANSTVGKTCYSLEYPTLRLLT